MSSLQIMRGNRLRIALLVKARKSKFYQEYHRLPRPIAAPLKTRSYKFNRAKTLCLQAYKFLQLIPLPSLVLRAGERKLSTIHHYY